MFEIMALKSAAEDRLPLTITLKPEARAIVQNLRDQTGVTLTYAMTAVLEWFSSLDANLRSAILNRDAAAREQIVRATMAQLAGREALQRAIASADMDLASLADLMRAVAARFDAVIAGDKAARPAKLGQLPRPAPESAQAPQLRKK